MFKSTIRTPLILSSLPPKTKLFSFPQTVRQNASTKTITTFNKILPPSPPPTSAYVHLPFCRKRCHYCDFPILALGSSAPPPQHDPRIIDYINILCREITATRSETQNPPLETVFFGGGTPSLVPPSLVETVLDTLRGKFGVCLDAEISIEMDPGTFDDEKIKSFMSLGVNRVSLGVQAFQDALLNACGRAHGLKEVYEAIKIVSSCGIGNWSMDLISSLPNQTREMWEESLTLTVEAQPPHVSVYDLQVEQETKFGTLYTPGEFPLPSETQSADFYRMASEILTKAGYEHYEISSYCKSGFQCKHNVTYWKNKPFYGFGLGSASYLNGKRFSRPKKLKDYTNYVKNLEDKLLESEEKRCVDDMDNAMDTVMLALRTAKGLDLKTFREAFGSSVLHSLFKAYRPYVESGHVACLDENRRPMTMDEFCSILSEEGEKEDIAAFIRLSDPDGFLLSNELISLAFRAIAP